MVLNIIIHEVLSDSTAYTKTLILTIIIIIIVSYMAPGKKGISKLYKLNPKAKTLYLSIPADIIKEEGFPFAEGDTVKIELDKDLQTILISKFD
jgi:hypothetical protein